MFLMIEIITLCPDANKMMLHYAISYTTDKLTKTHKNNFLNIKYNEVAQNQFKNLNLYEKSIKLHILNDFLC